MAQRYAVVGGGMSGLYYAAELLRMYPDAEVYLVENAATLGGTYHSVRYPGDKVFDYGMHLFYEACDERVDRVLREVLDDDEWHFWGANRKDVAGLYWRGRLQTGSHYVDLREFVAQGNGDIVSNLFASLRESSSWNDAGNCAEYFYGKYGRALAEQVFRPAQKKLWHAEPEELDPFAIKMVSADRVVLFDHDVMLDLMKSDALRARLAVPDQRQLPLGARSSSQRALYPRQYGFCHYIDRFAARLTDAGARLHLNTRITALAATDKQTIALLAQGPGGDISSLEFDQVFWSAPLMQLAQVLKIPIDDLKMDVPHHVAYAHFVLETPPVMEDLYYFYCYDAPFKTFRVTNYAAFCPGSEKDGYAICVELHYSGTDSPPDAGAAVELAKAELSAMGVVNSGHRVTFAGAHISRFGFPRPTLRNRQAFGDIRARISDRIPRGLSLGGVAPDLGRFFLQDILIAAADQLETLSP